MLGQSEAPKVTAKKNRWAIIFCSCYHQYQYFEYRRTQNIWSLKSVIFGGQASKKMIFCRLRLQKFCYFVGLGFKKNHKKNHWWSNNHKKNHWWTCTTQIFWYFSNIGFNFFDIPHTEASWYFPFFMFKYFVFYGTCFIFARGLFILI